MSGWRGVYSNLFTCELWGDTVQLQMCRWVTCRPGVCRHPAAIWSLLSLRHDEFLSQDTSIRTPSKRSRWETERLKRAEPGRYHWLGHNKPAALKRRRQAYREQLQRKQPDSEGDGQTRTQRKTEKTGTFEQSASHPKSVSIMGCLRSHPLNSALRTRAVSQTSVSHI